MIKKRTKNLIARTLKWVSPLWIAWLLSVLLHLVATVEIQRFPKHAHIPSPKKNQPIKIKLASPQPKIKKLSETPLPETKDAPDPNKSRYGKTNHRTKKETRVKPQAHPKAAEAVRKSSPNKATIKPLPSTHDTKVAQRPPKKPKTKPLALLKPKTAISSVKPQAKPSRLRVPSYSPKLRKARNNYEALLNAGLQNMGDVAQQGYTEALEEEIEIGEAIDINTSHYRYIGYFSGMRKAIEMVWNYPRTAVKKGYDGHVGLRFTIHKDGRVHKVKVTESSGHQVLDNAIVEAIHQAAPFSPLPEGFGRKSLVVMGTFRYVLGY